MFNSAPTIARLARAPVGIFGPAELASFDAARGLFPRSSSRAEACGPTPQGAAS
jgi:hypothetical protein